MPCLERVNKYVKDSLDILELFEEKDLIVLKYLDVGRTGAYINLPPGYTIVGCSETGEISTYEGQAILRVSVPCWLYILRTGGQPCRVPVGIPCTKDRPGFSFIAYFKIQSGIYNINPQQLISILAPYRNKVIKLNCAKVKEELLNVLLDILKRNYKGDAQKLYEDFYANRRNATWLVELIKDRMESIRVMARFITIDILQLEYVPPEKCPEVSD